MSSAAAPPSGLDVAFIDNYDSFSFNVVQYLQELGADVRVFRNDAVTVAELAALAPRRIVISPGPGAPKDAGVSCDVIRHFAGKVPILGVCLGACLWVGGGWLSTALCSVSHSGWAAAAAALQRGGSSRRLVRCVMGVSLLPNPSLPPPLPSRQHLRRPPVHV